MNLKNCRQCGKVYLDSGSLLCPACVSKMEEQYLRVRDYLFKNPKESIDIVSKETDVEAKIILQMIREGRLEMKAGQHGLTCRACSSPVDSGQYCTKCLGNISRNLKQATEESTLGENKSEQALNKAVRTYHINHSKK